ncbi:cilia- and flagella-associated protein 91-like isoform X2 [Diadema setosum]|uniref:cilia- and flagella-associated protein 91-like isoform X2 n=1 Tax=Diadema setosum TaxID=31175 RepID=UPI003B3B2493
MSAAQAMRRPRLQQTRTHDYLYDPVYTLSSQRDHARATFRANTNVERVGRVPAFNTMFSSLRHFPRFNMRLDPTDPVPRFISRQWRGYSDQAREALIRYKTFNYAPDLQVPPVHHPDAKVGGQNRYKYFRRPIIPFLQQVPPEFVMDNSLARVGQVDQVIQERAPTPPYRTIEIQTDYRESETQTDPYTPEYVVRPGSQPELLTLATLSFGHGLPAGLAEVEMIERARAKRAWEATLPPLNDVSQLEKRKKMMDEMERKEWALREQEIEKLQEARLQLLQKILREREENHTKLSAKRLDKLWAKKQQERERKVAWIRKEHIKAIRKLTEKRRKVEGKLERRDITKDYSAFASEAYAPMTRHGVFLDKGSEQYVVKSKYISTYQGLLELENSLPDFVTQPRVIAPKPKSSGKLGFIKRQQRRQNELNEIYKGIKNQKKKGVEPPKPLKFLQKIEKPIPRPPTPSVEVPDLAEEEKELAIIFLQQVIRGRAIQNMMFEGKEKRQELINELRSTHALQEAEQQMKKQEKQATLNIQRQRQMHDHRESFIDESLSRLEGAAIGDMLDFLSKELVRLQEERRIHAFAMLAERRRRVREAEESGRRQVEERRRREEDELFKQLVKVHQDTVDTYLEDIILTSMDRTADDQAREEIQHTAEQVNEMAYLSEERGQQRETVAELVQMFLLPEVQKLTIREQVKQEQRKHLLAAHSTIFKEAEGVIAKNSRPLGTPQAAQKPPSRPASASKSKRTPTPTGASTQDPAPVTSKLGSRPGSGKGSRPSSARKGSAEGSQRGSRTGSPKVKKSPATSPQPDQATQPSMDTEEPVPSTSSPPAAPTPQQEVNADQQEAPSDAGKVPEVSKSQLAEEPKPSDTAPEVAAEPPVSTEEPQEPEGEKPATTGEAATTAEQTGAPSEPASAPEDGPAPVGDSEEAAATPPDQVVAPSEEAGEPTEKEEKPAEEPVEVTAPEAGETEIRQKADSATQGADS